jgi:hypothetical protein
VRLQRLTLRRTSYAFRFLTARQNQFSVIKYRVLPDKMIAVYFGLLLEEILKSSKNGKLKTENSKLAFFHTRMAE